MSYNESVNLITAIGNFSLADVQAALEKGADPNFTRTGRPPLLMAVENNSYDVANALLDHPSIDPIAKNSAGWTPAHRLLGKESLNEEEEAFLTRWLKAVRTLRYNPHTQGLMDEREAAPAAAFSYDSSAALRSWAKISQAAGFPFVNLASRKDNGSWVLAAADARAFGCLRFLVDELGFSLDEENKQGRTARDALKAQSVIGELADWMNNIPEQRVSLKTPATAAALAIASNAEAPSSAVVAEKTWTEADEKAFKTYSQAAFETWLQEKTPSGDADDVQRQWEQSVAYTAAVTDFLQSKEQANRVSPRTDVEPQEPKVKVSSLRRR